MPGTAKPRLIGLVGFAIWFAFGLIAYMSGYVVVGPEGRGLTLCQSMYLMSQIITTVGYGDYTPATSTGRLFLIFHILFAGLLITGMFTQAVDWFVTQHAASAGNFVNGFLQAGEEDDQTWLEFLFPVLVAGFFFLIAILIWTLFFVYFCDIFHTDVDIKTDGLHECEDQTFMSAFYMAVVTMTTVGFGDITPRTAIGEAFCAFFSLVGIVTYINLVGAVTETLLKARENYRIEQLSHQDFDVADTNCDEKVDLFEFTRFILLKFRIVDSVVFQEVERNFNALDTDGSGFLDHQDLQHLVDKYDAKIKTQHI